MVYTIDEIKAKIKPIAEKYDLKTVYLFGSYARGEADEQSDVDIAFEEGNQELIWLGSDVVEDVKSSFDIPVDCLPVSFLEGGRSPLQKTISENFRKDRITIYENESFGERQAIFT